MPKSEITQFGFTWGGLTVERCASDEKRGWVILILRTKKHPAGIQVYVTKTGKVKIDGKEIK